MRQIKFRVWDGENLHYPDNDGWYNNVNVHPNKLKQSIRLTTAIKNLEVTQFTGIYDQDGKEIYEGDILLYGKYGGKETKVDWNDSMTGFYPFFGYPAIRNEPDFVLRVIGNIYDDLKKVNKYENI